MKHGHRDHENVKCRPSHVVVVGAGPAGMMAAIAAAGRGARVTLCEQLERPGTKLLATGGGHCNLSNTLPESEFMARFGRHGRFMRPALSAISREGLCAFLKTLRVPTCSPDGFRIFPVSNKASDVQAALKSRCIDSGAGLFVSRCINALVVDDGRIRGVRDQSGQITADAVVLATGGKSYPGLGATGAGLEIARKAGHAIVEPVPALVPLRTKEEWTGAVAGVSVSPARVWINLPGHGKKSAAGDILFTHHGISGPAVLDLSGDVAELLRERTTVPVGLDLRPDVPPPEWMALFETWQKSEGKKKVSNLLDRRLPGSLAKIVCELALVPADTTASRLSRIQRQNLAKLLTSLDLTVISTEGFGKAMITRGGISLREVNPETLESRIVRGLFLAGEILDLDGPTGGFNLQWAFSSGWLAGESAGRG